MAIAVFVLISIAALVRSAESAGGTCERIENRDGWEGSIGTLKTCFMLSTAINSKDFSITSDRDMHMTVKGFYAFINNNLEYLPNNLGAKFPNLIALRASWCSIKEIRKNNFEGLSTLQHLILNGNQIEKIDDDTFEHIPAVEQIWLLFNKIKKLNGRAFASLHKLTYVDLEYNECINEEFTTAARIAEMSAVVSKNCGFFEPCNEKTCLAKNAKLEADLKAKSEKLRALGLDITKLKTQAELQLAQHNQINAQLNETCDARAELKLQEIFNLSNDLQAKTAEVNEKNEKIKQLQKKLQILDEDGSW